MKKKLLFVLGLSNLLVLGACGQSENPSESQKSDTSSQEEKVFNFSDYATKFNANVEQKIVQDSKESKASYVLDYATDHVSMVFGEQTQGYYYKKGKTGALERLYINEENEVSSDKVDEVMFDGSFTNVFGEVGETTDLTLVEDGGLNQLGEKFLATFAPFWSDGGYSDVVASVSIGKEFVFSFKAKEDSKEFELKATLVDASNYRNYTLSPLEETEESKGIAAIIAKLKENNYTCTLKQGGTIKGVYYLNPTALLKVKGKEKEGFVKTETGYSNVTIKDDIPTYGTSSSDSFSSLLPSFEFAPEIIVDGEIEKNVYASNLSRVFLFGAERKTNVQFSSFLATSDTFEYVLGEGEDALTISYSNIGKTTLPIDILNIKVSNWKDTNEEVHQFFVAILGENYNLPAWSDLDWSVTVGKDNSFLTLDASVDDDEEGESSIKAYIQKLDGTPGLTRWTDEEWNNVKDDIETGVHSDGTDEIYHINDKYSLQVYFCLDEWGIMGGSFAGLMVRENSFFLK